MKAEDLMLGDWVVGGSGEPFKIGIIDPDFLFWDEVHPIPLTPEILEKNGWCYNNEDEKFFPQTWVGVGLMLHDADDCCYRIVVTSDYDDEDTNNTPFILRYVHELQHALKLCGIEKEIVL